MHLPAESDLRAQPEHPRRSGSVECTSVGETNELSGALSGLTADRDPVPSGTLGDPFIHMI